MGDIVLYILILVFLIGMTVLIKISSDIFEYKNYLIIKEIEKIFVPSYFAILSFVSCFLDFEYWVSYIALILFSLFSLCYFFIDCFYFQQQEKEHIVMLQNNALTNVDIKNIFEIKTTTACYESKIIINGIKGFSITKSEFGDCIQLKSKELSLLYIPKVEMSEIKMKYCMKFLCMNSECDYIPLYPSSYGDEYYNKHIICKTYLAHIHSL